MFSKILYILLALVILMVLITVHEFGHYIAGKIFKFKINEFSIGFGKAIYKKTRKDGEVFSIRILPLGGYCAFEGEDEENPGKDAFNSKPAWQRLIVLFSGVLFNFIFGILTSAIYLMVAGYGVPVISAANDSIIAQNLRVGDKIVAVNNKTIEAYRPAADLMAKYANENTITLTIERNGEVFDVEIEKLNQENGYYYVANAQNIIENLYIATSFDGENNPLTYQAYNIDDFRQYVINSLVTKTIEEDKTIYTPEFDQKFYQLVDVTDPTTGDTTKVYQEYTHQKMIEDGVLVHGGVGKSLGIVYYQVAQKYGFFESLLKAWPFAFYICGVILKSLGGLFTGATKIKDLTGTIGTISTIANVSAMNPLNILFLFPMLSLNLAVFNFLPIPALDGARSLFVLWEAITKKPVNRKVEGIIHTVGLIVLLALVVFLDVYNMIIVPLTT